jgi:hypothetical protein
MCSSEGCSDRNHCEHYQVRLAKIDCEEHRLAMARTRTFPRRRKVFLAPAPPQTSSVGRSIRPHVGHGQRWGQHPAPRDSSGGVSFGCVEANNQWACLDSHFQSFDFGAFQTVGGPFETMAKHSEDFTVATWDRTVDHPQPPGTYDDGLITIAPAIGSNDGFL